jgi:hypothetical protein
LSSDVPSGRELAKAGRNAFGKWRKSCRLDTQIRKTFSAENVENAENVLRPQAAAAVLGL